MPTRREKKFAHARWHVCFARHSQTEKWKSELERACGESRAPVEFCEVGRMLVELRWPYDVKYDNVVKFLRRFAKASEADPQFTVRRCRKDCQADAPVSVPVTAAPTEPFVRATSTQAPAPPASAPSLALPSLAASSAPSPKKDCHLLCYR